jgi:hypothetical protein
MRVLYFAHMGDKLRNLIGRVEKWPQQAREELVRSIAEIETRYGNVYHVSSDERVALDRSAQDVRKARYASDQDVDAVFGRFHRT